MAQRFMIVDGRDCVRYLIPVDRWGDWYAWTEDREPEPVPKWARVMDRDLAFTDPRDVDGRLYFEDETDG